MESQIVEQYVSLTKSATLPKVVENTYLVMAAFFPSSPAIAILRIGGLPSAIPLSDHFNMVHRSPFPLY